MKVIIAGGREFMNYGLLKTKCDYLLKNKTEVEIVSGKAKGADSLGELYAKENNYPIHEFPANWNMHGNAAGPIRNQEMGNFADVLIAFWNGESKGTKHMIDYMRFLNKPVKIVYY
jgi:hypothetical protein